METKRKPWIVDTTLRDGEQSAGVVFSLADKLRIARLLDLMGIDEIEAGTPAMGRQAIEEIKIIHAHKLAARISVWSRALKEDIDLAAETGAEGINISFPVSDIQLKAINKDKQWVLQALPEIIAYAQQRFLYVSIGAQDATRADQSFLIDYVDLANTCGAFRIRIADTVGVSHPLEVQHLFNTLNKTIPTANLEFHGHNDLGMATANAMVALKSGADSVSVTVNGLGERAGNSPLEEVLMAMYLDNGFYLHYNTRYIMELCRFVALRSNHRIPDNKPVTGKKALMHESGIHTRSLLVNRKTYQPFLASEIGAEEQPFVFGKHSGKAAIKSFLLKQGHSLSDDNISFLHAMVKIASQHNRAGLSGKDILSFLRPSTKANDLEMYNGLN